MNTIRSNGKSLKKSSVLLTNRVVLSLLGAVLLVCSSIHPHSHPYFPVKVVDALSTVHHQKNVKYRHWREDKGDGQSSSISLRAKAVPSGSCKNYAEVERESSPYYYSRRDIFKSTSAAIIAATTTSDFASPFGVPSASAEDQSQSPYQSPYLQPEYYQNKPITAPTKGRYYFPTLTPPFQNRATYRYNLGKNFHQFEQLLTFSNVTATIKTTVVRLRSTGGLWVHGPQWPTGEFLHLLDDLGGEVEHVVLPCNAFEHAAPMKAFCKRYPGAKVWVSPGQYGPFGSCGTSSRKEDERCTLGYRVDGIFATANERLEGQGEPLWSDEFDYRTLYIDLPENAGPVSEVAFLHKPSKTLIVTDGLIYVPDEPSPIFETYFTKKNGIMEDDDEAFFWPKTVLQSVFLPLRVERKVKSDDGDDDGTYYYPGYEAIRGRLLRAPILRGFNDARAPQLTKQWIESICEWDFNRVVTSHFASPIAATPRNVRDAFAFLDLERDSSGVGVDESSSSLLPPIACQDWELLDGLNDFIATNKIGAPATFDYRADCK